jgi:hypothetical protein
MSARVLVVDDNSLVPEGLRFMLTYFELQAAGYQCRVNLPRLREFNRCSTKGGNVEAKHLNWIAGVNCLELVVRGRRRLARSGQAATAAVFVR